MNENKLKRLFAAAQKEAAPVPPADFAADVLRAVRREPAPRLPESGSVFDQLNRWFPRIAIASAVIILLCIAADFGLTSAGLPELGDGAAQISSQFDLNEDGL
jgi:hypothetical protein